MKTPPTAITRIMFEGQSFPIEASDGKRTISSDKNIVWIDPDFKDLWLDQPSQPTKMINVVVHEMTAKGTFLEIFSGINNNPSKLVMTMAQILIFCGQHRDKLRQDGFVTFFLTERTLNIFQKIRRRFFNREPKYFVVRVYVLAGGLDVHVSYFESGHIWSGQNNYRLVSPQPIP